MSPTPRRRPERVAALIQETVGEILTTRVKDPRVGFVTVTGVSVSPDCTHASVRVSVLGEDADKAKAMEGLESAKGFLRSQLAKVVSLRVTPELHFHLDRGMEHARRINEILGQIKHGEQH